MVDPSVVGVTCLCLVRADVEVVCQLVWRTCVRCRKQLQVVKCDRINGSTCCAVGPGEQRLGAVTRTDAVDVVVLREGWDSFDVCDARNQPLSLIVKVEEGPVPEDGPTDASAELVKTQFRLATVCLKHIATVEDIVAEELIHAS